MPNNIVHSKGEGFNAILPPPHLSISRGECTNFLIDAAHFETSTKNHPPKTDHKILSHLLHLRYKKSLNTLFSIGDYTKGLHKLLKPKT